MQTQVGLIAHSSLLLVISAFCNYGICHITFYSFILCLCHILSSPRDYALNFEPYVPKPTTNLKPSGHSPNICGTELCRNCRVQWIIMC